MNLSEAGMNLWKVLGRFCSFFKGEEGVSAVQLNNADDNRLLEGNPCTSDTEDELITTLPSTSSLKGERESSTPNSCSATNCGTRILSANAVLEAEIAPTPNLLQNHPSTTPMDSVPIINFEVAARFFERNFCATFCQTWSAEYYFGKLTNLRQRLAWWFS